MAYKPTRMDQIKRILTLEKEGKKIKQIARTLGMSKNTVKKYLRRHTGLDDNTSDSELEFVLQGK